MKINFTGHGIDVTPALQAFANEKFAKLEKHFERITSIHVIFSIEKHNQIAEATIIVHKNELHASSESDTMYTAIDLLVDKLDKQLIKYKEKMKDHRD
ncbi:MAG: ribosomal subunit interface protein [Legionellales bacterium RIFCSPHIGHO2_12_FULL_35_11]|nr:MAG: ribosomal subunit interface protein [Legionellales bacterium RIFCSPHIGHO2_12_FULL_35_11]